MLLIQDLADTFVHPKGTGKRLSADGKEQQWREYCVVSAMSEALRIVVIAPDLDVSDPGTPMLWIKLSAHAACASAC